MRTSDVRLHHRILVQLRERPYTEAVFDLFWPLEAILDLELDIKDYKKDVTNNHYITLRMLSAIVGPKRAPTIMRHRLATYERRYVDAMATCDSMPQVCFKQIRKRYRKDHPEVQIPRLSEEPVLAARVDSSSIRDM